MQLQYDSFVWRHIGPRQADVEAMVKFLGYSSLDEVIAGIIPTAIRSKKPLGIAPGLTEQVALAELREMVARNKEYRSFIGQGYSDCFVPPVIQRNILENPGWYTQYTPYQSEIAQGRLEALLNFQTMIMDLTAMEVANASLLDEATAAAEAMNLCYTLKDRDPRKVFLVASDCHPQTIEVLRTRAEPMGIELVIDDPARLDVSRGAFGVLLQYPATDGVIHDYRAFIEAARREGVLVVMAADPLALALLTPPGELGADVAIGSAQRFGVPLGFGGPHPAFLATREVHKRLIPGRIVGVSKDVDGRPAVRLALQTREQHIRRDKATSNICTAQVLLAVMAGMYAVYHGPEGIRAIAQRVHAMAGLLHQGVLRLGYSVRSGSHFDTIRVHAPDARKVLAEAEARRMNLRLLDPSSVVVALDEATTERDLMSLLEAFAAAAGKMVDFALSDMEVAPQSRIPGALARKSAFLTHPVFNRYHSETEMLRYLRRLESRDLSLTQSMIPLGSCTMKLNATSEMLPVSWPGISRVHPFAPPSQTEGYRLILSGLERMLAEITGYPSVSLQPNAGSQGEYAGLLVIRKYHQSRGEAHRKVCLIPRSAHGTNPASAAMAGMSVVVVECDSAGNVDVADLRDKAERHRADLAALMVTYPSTHGVFEEAIQEICAIVHRAGGQVYMDGANMNAQVGLCRPGDYGPDVCHLNLHKTFCIPHGGGGPGMGPIGVREHLAPFLPGHPAAAVGGERGIGPVSAAPWGSASILPISWMYIRMMGGEGLRLASEVAILNANYIARRLAPHYPILFKGRSGLVAHECIFDLRQFRERAGIEVDDVAKRLMDYGFHAPTVSFPVAGTMMVEPTESESREELDRFCEAMIAIRREIADIEAGRADRVDNALRNAPHTARQVTGSEWTRPYSREQGAFPAPWTREHKFWPSVGRINNVLGDRNLVCSCPPIDEYA